MRPLKLVIEGLRSFRTPVTIDFEDCEQIAIVGDTGAGKSSILDAITYALYRQTTFSKQPNQELMNASAAQMRVVLTFRISGQTWTVTRALKRSKVGVVGVPPALSRLGDGGEKLETFAGVASVDERIQRLVGLDSDAFLRTVVLPQGNFARLLVADGTTERTTVLRQVWRTDELERAGEAADKKAAEAKELRMELDAKAFSYPANPDAHLKTLREDRTAARKAAKRAKNGLDAANAAVAALDAAAKEAELCQGVLQGLEGADVSELTAPLDSLQSLADEIDRQDEALAVEAEKVEAKINEIQDDDAPSLANVTEMIERLNQVDGDIRLLAEMAGDWHRLRTGKADADKMAADAEEFKNNAGQAADEHRDKRKELDESLAKATTKREDVESKYAACEQCHSDKATARKELQVLEQELEQQEARKTRLDDGVMVALEIKKRTEADLRAATRADCAAGAAHGLGAGDACPICDRALPTDWQAPPSAEIGDADTRDREAAVALQEAQESAKEADVALANARAKHGEVSKLEAATGARFQNLMQELRNVVPGVGLELPARADLLDPLHDNEAKAQATIEEHNEEQVRLDDARDDAAEDTDAAKANAWSLEREAAEAQRLVSTKAGEVRSTLKALPEQFRPNVTLPNDMSPDYVIGPADLSERRGDAENLKAKLEEAERSRRVLDNRRKTLLTQRDALSRKRELEVEAPTNGLLTKAIDLHGKVIFANVKLDTDQNLPAAPAKADLRNIRASLIEIRRALEGTRQDAGKRVEAAEEERQYANVRLAKFAKGLDVAADDPEAIAEAVYQANIVAQTTKLGAEQAFNDFSAVVDAVRRLHDVRAKTEARERALAALAAALKPSAFLKWLTLRRSRSLLSHASVMLKRMSGGRYAFADPEEADAPWQVLDNDTGQSRSPASLSGGEQFIASLALALGMVEMMARSGGRLESLFLDEGFGSLDRNNLDAAVEALAMVAAHGRMVGVISHVRAVAEQFDNVLAVTREETGSQAVWLSNQQRQDMAVDALSGLLD